MKNRRNKMSLFLVLGGLLLIAAAFCLTGYNIADSWRAGWMARRILAEMETGSAEREAVPANSAGNANGDEASGGNASGDSSGNAAGNGDTEGTSWMAVIPVDGNTYIGVLEIPKLELQLPVMSQWSYPKLRIAPCRYQGTAAEGNLIIAGHNYERHFGNLKNLKAGEKVTFTDVEGNAYAYQVQKVEQLEPTDIQKMEAGDWDLTLFTCTVGGRYRVVVRCCAEDGGMDYSKVTSNPKSPKAENPYSFSPEN